MPKRSTLSCLVAALTLTLMTATPAVAETCDDDNPLTSTYVDTWADRYHATKYQITVYDVQRDCTYRASTYSGAFPTASVVKVMIAIGVLERVTAGTTSYSSVRPTLAAMITVSDNDGAQRLYRRINRAKGIVAVSRHYGLTHTRPGRSWGLTKTTADDQVLLLRRALLDDSPTLSSKQQRRLLQLMRHVTRSQRWGVGHGLPKGWYATMKNGWYHTVPGDEGPANRSRVNTMGIVWDSHGEPRYVLAGFSHSWRTDRAGIKAWNALSTHVAKVLYR